MKRKFWMLLLVVLWVQMTLAQTNGTLTVSVTTSSAGGNYAPRNVVAIWVEDTSGKFVKTLLAYAATRKTHLNTWEASSTAAGSAFNVVDATTGATQSNHGTRTCSWNGTDYTGKVVADGNYNLRMELTDKNDTGNKGSFPFTKGIANQKLTPTDIPSFSSISVNWTSSVTSTNPEFTANNTIIVYPNPGKGVFSILGENIRSVKVTDLSGKTIRKSLLPVIDLGDQPEGVYLFLIKTDERTTIEKIIKN